MDFDLMDFFNLLTKIKIRRYLFMLMVIMTTIRYLKVRYERKRITQEEEEALIDATYEKDENGLYPWEVDTDDHPSRVDNMSEPLKKTWGAQRGRW